METKKSSSVQWLVIGVVMLLLLILQGGLEAAGLMSRNSDLHYFGVMILGGGGAIISVIGLIRIIVQKLRN